MIIEIQKENKFELLYKPESAVYSGYQLKIIPINPNFEPSKEQQRKIINLLIDKFENHEIISQLSDEVNFIDQGENFTSVSCNHCQKEFSTEFWQEAMDKAFQKSFKDLNFITTCCCNKETNLNDLNYDFPAGFSRYCIVVVDPEIEIFESNQLIAEIEKILVQKVKIIRAHY